MAPYNFQVKRTKAGYFFGWESVVAPGRPEPKYFILESRLGNGTWKPIKISAAARSYLFPLSSGKNGKYGFRMYADGVFASTMVEPKAWTSGGTGKLLDRCYESPLWDFCPMLNDSNFSYFAIFLPLEFLEILNIYCWN